MPDEIPELSLGLGANGENVVLLGEHDPIPDMAALLRLEPGLASADHALDLAHAVNHFARGNEYRVIANPKEFEAAYLAKISSEDPTAEWQEGVVRLRDYGVPDFKRIEPPKFTGGKLVFHAEDAFLGVPYEVETADLLAAPAYEPLPLTPLPRPPRSPAGSKVQPVTPPKLEARPRTPPGNRPQR